MTIKAPSPTHGHPAGQAPAGSQNPATATGKPPLWAIVVGVGILVAMADTRAAPLAVAIASAAVLFQLLRA
jgi:hypothetical protein